MKANEYRVFVRFCEPPEWATNHTPPNRPTCWAVTLWAVNLAHDPVPSSFPLGEAAGIGDTFEAARKAALGKLRKNMRAAR
jgi:hypothetical protein